MISPALAHFLTGTIVGVSILLMLIRPRNISEVYWIGAGALLLLILRLVPLRVAGQAFAKAADVCVFLIGMMMLSELAREQGVFEWLSSVAVRGADGSCAAGARDQLVDSAIGGRAFCNGGSGRKYCRQAVHIAMACLGAKSRIMVRDAHHRLLCG